MEFFPPPDGVTYAEIIAAMSALFRLPFDALRARLQRRHRGLAHV
jgi:hypothetical protein